MSTKAMIAIYKSDRKKLWNFDEIFYKLSDGYPEDLGVVHYLVPFLGHYTRVMKNNTYFLMANLIYLMQKDSWGRGIKRWNVWKKEKREQCKFWESDIFESSIKEIGVSKDDMFHKDMNYLYRINIESGNVLVYKVVQSLFDMENDKGIGKRVELLYVIPFNENPKGGFTLRNLSSYRP